MTHIEASRSLRAPVWTRPDADLASAARQMASEGTSSVLVGAPGELVSILTERDIAHAVARGVPPTTPVGEVAVPAPVAVSCGATVREAARAMLEQGVRHLVVSREGRAVAVVSMRDVLAALVDAPQAEVVLAVAAEGFSLHSEHWFG